MFVKRWFSFFEVYLLTKLKGALEIASMLYNTFILEVLKKSQTKGGS